MDHELEAEYRAVLSMPQQPEADLAQVPPAATVPTNPAVQSRPVVAEANAPAMPPPSDQASSNAPATPPPLGQASSISQSGNAVTEANAPGGGMQLIIAMDDVD